MLILTGLGLALAEEQPRFIVRSWQSEDGLPGNTVRAVAQSADDWLWVATAEGVVRFDGVSFYPVKYADTEWRPRSVIATEDGSVWVPSVHGGLSQWRAGKLVELWEDEEEPSTYGQTQGINFLPSGEIVVSTSKGLYKLQEEGTPQQVKALPSYLRSSVSGEPQLQLTDKAGRQWNVEARGLVVRQVGVAEHVLPEFTDGQRITSLFQDQEGSLWVATNGAGLFQVRGSRVQLLSRALGLPETKSRMVLEDRQGGLWTANQQGELLRSLGGKQDAFVLGEQDRLRLITAMCEDRAAGTLWVAKDNGSIYRYADAGFQLMSRDGPWMRRVAAMEVDDEGVLWLGGASGLASWRQGVLSKIEVTEGLVDKPVSALAVDARQQVWVGYADGAVYAGRERFRFIGSVPEAAVSALKPDHEDRVWVATLGAGLYLAEGDRLKKIPCLEQRLTSVLEDGFGRVWLASLTGIYGAQKQALLTQAEGVAWLHLDRADGMASRECTGGFQPASWQSRAGQLWFPTARGLVSFDPESLHLSTEAPRVELLGPSSQQELGPGRTRLEFHYTALSYVAPEKLRFRTRLLGLQSVWQEQANQRSVSYESVPPGDYEFQVLAANADGVWSELPVSLAVMIRPHFWETTWFQLGALCCITLLAFGIGSVITRARSRMKLLQLQAQTAHLLERERIAQDLHDDLGASLTEISLLAGLAAEDAQQEKLPVIAEKAQHLVSTLDEIVWAVNPRHDTLASFVEYLSASAAELLEAAGIALRLEIAESLPGTVLDSTQRHSLFLAAREAINNAVKHSHTQELRLCVSHQGGVLSLSVIDAGRGFSQEAAASSEGLRNMQARMTALGGACCIKTGERGTEVVLTLPLLS